MKPFLVLMSLLNVGIASVSGFFAMRVPFVFGTGGAIGNTSETAAVVPFALVAAFPMFCLIAAALPFLLEGRRMCRAAVALALAPSVIALGVGAIVLV